jgi:lipopolysaccharide transport system ATP-binding protein
LVQNPIFGIGIYDEKGIHCFGTNTHIKKIKIEKIGGEGLIELNIKKLTTLEGKFFLTVAVHAIDYKTSYDWLDKMFSFVVVKSSDDVGLFNIPCEWKIP